MSLRRKLVSLLVLVALVTVDQVSKVLVLTHLSDGTIVTVIPRVLQFRYIENTGAAFSMLSGKTVFLSIVTAIILVAVVVLLLLGKVPGRWNQAALLLMAAGGAGNLIDRVHRHFVVDFMEFTFTNFAVFNFADCCVTIGAAILILSTLVSFWKESGETKDQES